MEKEKSRDGGVERAHHERVDGVGDRSIDLIPQLSLKRSQACAETSFSMFLDIKGYEIN